MNTIEQLQYNESGFHYIKSYPILNQLDIAPLDKQLIELVLSHQDNGVVFTMNYKKIAQILNAKKQSLKNVVQKLKKNGYIKTVNKPNYEIGGSSTTIEVDTVAIIKTINNMNAVKKIIS